MDERRQLRRRIDKAEDDDGAEVTGANYDTAAMAMMILSTDLARHRSTFSVDGSDGINDNQCDGSESTSSSSSSSSVKSSDTDTSEDESEHSSNRSRNDDGLSEYERLRLENIERNHQRLASLGLLRTEDDKSRKKNAGAEFASNSSRKRTLAPPPRRSLPHRRCSKHKHHDNDSNDDHGDDDDENEESSLMPSPVPIKRALRPQSHQRSLDEYHLKEYMRTRRIRRGRPRREEYEYKCEEKCATCGGGWIFDNGRRYDGNNDIVNDFDGNNFRRDDAKKDEHNVVDENDDPEDIEDRTRLIRCKDCRGAFHLECMLIHGKENCESAMETICRHDAAEDDRITSMVEPSTMMTRDPKRCYQCEVKRQNEGQLLQTKNHRPFNLATTCALTLHDATIGNRMVVVRVSNAQVLLEANVEGRDIACIVTLHGRLSSKCGRSLENAEEEDGSIPRNKAHEIQLHIDKAQSNSANARIQTTSCIALRNYLISECFTSTVARLGGIRMLLNSLRCHLDRPNIQAEAICTLTEIHRECPRLIDGEMIRWGGCLDLAKLAMERHPFHAKVQLMACRMFRALSHDANCCSKLKSKKVVSAVVDSIRRNPRKRDVTVEGSMFLQNILTYLTKTTVNSLLRLKSRSNDDFPGLIPTLIASIKTNKSDLNHVVSLFSLLSTVTLISKGSALLRVLSIDSLVVETIHEHLDAPHLHEITFELLRNAYTTDECETMATAKRNCDLINLALKSAMKYPRNAVLQANVCRLLVVLTSPSDGKAQRLVQGKRCRRILTLASENFPDGCREAVHVLLCNN